MVTVKSRSLRIRIFIFYLFNVLWYVPLLLSIVSLYFHIPIYFKKLFLSTDDVYYLQESTSVVYFDVSGGSSFDLPNVYFFITSILIIVLFLLVNFLITYKRPLEKWHLMSIFLLYLIITSGLYYFELIGV